MLSEGALRAERIIRQLSKYSSNRGVPEEELEWFAYVLLVSMILSDESLTWELLPPPHSAEFENLLKSILMTGHPDLIERELQQLMHLLEQVASTAPVEIARGAGVLPLAIRYIAGMLAHELEHLHREERLRVLDALFYKLYTRLVPSDQKHHAQIGCLSAALIGLYDVVWESFPGPGEVFVVSSTPDEATYEYQRRQLELPGQVSNSLRFIRNLRIACNKLDFELRDRQFSKSYVRLVDTTLSVSRSAYGDSSVVAFDVDNLERIIAICQSDDSPMLAVLGGKDRRPVKNSKPLREAMVRQCGLRAVVDIRSLGSKGNTALSLLYFGRPFPGKGDSILHLDARRLHWNASVDEVQTFAALAGALIRVWAQGQMSATSLLEMKGVPRRVLAFLEETLRHDSSAVPGLLRFVSEDEMLEGDCSLRAADYVGISEERSWQPEVDIAPALKLLDRGKDGAAVYLIGNNGAGKSLALRDIAMALASAGRKSFGISFGVTDRFERLPSSEPLKSHFKYAGARTFRSGPNVRRTLGELGDMVKDIYKDAARLDCFEAALDTLGFSRRQYLVPVDMGSTANDWERRLAEIHPLTSFSGTERERDELEEWQTLPSGEYKLALLRRDSPELAVFDSLSSGEQQILTMVIKIAARIARDTFVLLDEPEISLHVAWQRNLPLVLREFSRRLECSFVVATHSPVVIASTDDVMDFCFVMREGQLIELKPSQRRSIEASLFEGFKTYTPYTHHIQERCAEIISKVIGQADDEGLVSAAEAPYLDELRSLKKNLEETEGKMSDRDIALVGKAIVAVRELLSP